ncbi:MAG: cupin domain-containing protein [Candidatus Limnocylindria bacterium]
MSEGRGTLLDALLRIRDEQRAATRDGAMVLHGRDLLWEHNRLGKMRWYLHPSIRGAVIRDFIFHMQELPPGGRSGRLRTPGDEVLLIVEGRGYTMLDGVRHEWKAGDVVGLPVRADGMIVQHFNSDPGRRARFVSARPNLVDSLGVDRGAGFEILEDAASDE